MKSTTKTPIAVAAAVTTIAVVIWWALSFETYWKSGNYQLVAIDNLNNMSLMFSSDSHVSLVGSTIFAVGENEQFIVLKQHPPIQENISNDRTKTNYFIVTRALNREAAGRDENIRGPLNKAQFDNLSKQLKLPAFSKTFEELE